jgi:hypothetical protein
MAATNAREGASNVMKQYRAVQHASLAAKIVSIRG